MLANRSEHLGSVGLPAWAALLRTRRPGRPRDEVGSAVAPGRVASVRESRWRVARSVRPRLCLYRPPPAAGEDHRARIPRVVKEAGG